MGLRESAELVLQIKEILEKRGEAGIYNYVPDDHPNHNQLLFHKSKALIRFASGGNKSGKSVCGSAEIVWWATGTHPYQITTNYPPECYVLSAQSRTLYAGIWRHLDPDRPNGMKLLPRHLIKKIGPRMTGVAENIPTFIEVKWQKADGTFHAQPAKITFITAFGGESAREKLQSAAVDLLAIDEEVGQKQWEEALTRLVDTGGKAIITATQVRSEDWLVKLEDRGKANDPEVLYVNLNTDFNKHIDQDHARKIFSQFSEEEQEIRRYGKSRRGSGLIYRNYNVKPIPDNYNGDPREIFPSGTHYYCVLDDGFRVTAALWLAHLPNNQIEIYREMYLKQAEVHRDTVPFLKSIPESISQYIIDPSAFSRLRTGDVGVADILNIDYGFTFIKGNNDVRAGISAVQAAWERKQLWVWNTLANFMMEIRNYRIKPDRSQFYADEHKGKPRKKDDHLMDCMKMGVLAICGNPIIQVEEIETEPDVSEKWKRNREKRLEVHPILGADW